MRMLKGMVAGALALGGLLIVQSEVQANTQSVPTLTPIALATGASETATCGWHRGWHGHYGWHRHWGGYGWHRPYGFYRPVYHHWHRPYGFYHPAYYGWHHPWGWHRHYGWRRW